MQLYSSLVSSTALYCYTTAFFTTLKPFQQLNSSLCSSTATALSISLQFTLQLHSYLASPTAILTALQLFQQQLYSSSLDSQQLYSMLYSLAALQFSPQLYSSLDSSAALPTVLQLSQQPYSS